MEPPILCDYPIFQPRTTKTPQRSLKCLVQSSQIESGWQNYLLSKTGVDENNQFMVENGGNEGINVFGWR